jgi:DNA-binding transcriptional regulator/RsmH inhibitor MraZ
VEENGKIVPLGAPNGVFAVSVDEKGRLKLPAAMLAYLESLKEDRKVFITTFDEAEFRIYPISVWRETAKKLQEPGDDADYLEALARIADHYGKDVEVDAQGRLTLPELLRKALTLEKDEVHLRCFQGRINGFGRAEYEKSLAEARSGLADKIKVLKRKAL